MKLKYLIKGLSVVVKGSNEIEISGVTANSNQVAPGYLFLAKKGLTHDGSKFISDAVAKGAVAVVTTLYDPCCDCVQVISSEPQSLEGVLANRFYDSPAEKLFLVGITGTNGKTTTSYLIKHLLDSCGLIGTIQWIIGDKILPATHTTPDLITLTKLFHDMVSLGCPFERQAAVMEVSSHALVQGRIRGVPFDVAVFTNLTLDHLDYHGTMENYAAAKAELFAMLPKEGIAVYNIDDAWHPRILQSCLAQKLSYGFSPRADLRALEMRLDPKGMEFMVEYKGRKTKVSSCLVGRFNVYNLLGAIGVGLAGGLPFDVVIKNLKSFEKVPGRLERVLNARGLNIFVDYAHTDDALRNVLETLREFKTGRIITVFGCGGSRDSTKRPKMASVAEALSDFVIVTTDNPRQENPQEIIGQILLGFKKKSCFTVVSDRKEAIYQAVSMARRDDLILIAGKGHETSQIFSHQTIPFDDREVARQAAIC